MATATIGREIAIPLSAAASWWKRRDTYALAAVVALHVAAAGPVLWMWEVGFLQIGTDVGVMNQMLEGAVIGQCFLLSIWGALGGLRTIVRWAIVVGVYLLAVACVGFCFRNELDIAVRCLDVGLIGGIVVTSFAVAMLPLRGLAGWRVDFDLANYDHIRMRRGQVSFVDFAALSCAVAVPLALMRLAGESSEEAAGGAVARDAEWIGHRWLDGGAELLRRISVAAVGAREHCSGRVGSLGGICGGPFELVAKRG